MPFGEVVKRSVWEHRDGVTDILTELCMVGITLAVWGSLVLLVWGVAPS